MGKVVMQLNAFEDEDRVEIFKIANRLATRIGLKLVHVTDGEQTIDLSGQTETYLNYKILVDLTHEAHTSLDELEIHVRFAPSGFAVFPDERRGIAFTMIPVHLERVLDPQRGILFSWFVQGRILTSAISQPLNEILRGANDIVESLKGAFPLGE